MPNIKIIYGGTIKVYMLNDLLNVKSSKFIFHFFFLHFFKILQLLVYRKTLVYLDSLKATYSIHMLF